MDDMDEKNNRWKTYWFVLFRWFLNEPITAQVTISNTVMRSERNFFSIKEATKYLIDNTISQSNGKIRKKDLNLLITNFQQVPKETYDEYNNER